MSLEEINSLLKTSYGEDLGYNSEDAEYEFYKNFKTNGNNSTLIHKGKFHNGKVFQTNLIFIFHLKKKTNSTKIINLYLQ
jgi:hypothetical protein